MESGSSSPFDSLASVYDAWFEQEGKLIFAIEVDALKTVLPLLPGPWLEVGVGSGRFARSLGIDTGIDPSSRLLDIARKRGVNTFLARGEDRVFDKDTFGAVFLILTLCFLESPPAVLREIHRILIPGGKIVLGTVLKQSPWGSLYESKKKSGHRFYKYADFYGYPELIKLLTESGFAIEKVISTLFQKPGRVINMEDPLDEFSADAGFVVIVAGKTKSADRVTGRTFQRS